MMSQSADQVDAMLQPQDRWMVGNLLNPHFANLSYLSPPRFSERAPDGKPWVYSDNEQVWADVVSGVLPDCVQITLRGFELFPWVPRSPGVYFSPNAAFARAEALQYLDHRFGNAPIRRIDHAWELSEGQQGFLRESDHTLVFSPRGKQSMLDGGVGCVRLKYVMAEPPPSILALDPEMRDREPIWLMSASSDGVAHKGFPLGLRLHLRNRHHERLVADGALRCNITGYVMFLPSDFVHLFDTYVDYRVPPVYLLVTDIDPVDHADVGRRLEVSVAVSFVSDYRGPNDIYASYVTFAPDEQRSYDQAVSWLKTEYVEGGFQGRIITDFDQTQAVFPEARLALARIMARHVDKSALRKTLELLHARGSVAAYLDEVDKQELLRRRSGQIRRSVFISYNHNERDTQFMERAGTHLRAVFHGQDVRIWDDSRIKGGARWEREIRAALAATRVAVLIVSADYLASDYVRDHELPTLLLAAKTDGATILTLVSSSCSIAGDAISLEEFQFVNREHPLDRMSPDEQEATFRRLADFAVDAFREVPADPLVGL